jgi:hypothetical protein
MDLDRVLSGKVYLRVSDDLVCVHPPDAELRYLADFLSQDVYDEAIRAGSLTLQELEIFLRAEGLWSKEDEDLLEKISSDLETLKLDYFNSFHFKRKLITIKEEINRRKRQYREIANKRMYLSEYTAESAQVLWRESYIVERTAKLAGGGGAVVKYGINKVLGEYRSSQLSDDVLRRVAKSDDWRPRWVAMKKGVNPFLSSDLTNEQLALVTWSTMYDSIHESMDCPTDDVIQDDTALDGWLIHQSRKRKSEKMQEQNQGQGAEVFVPTNYRSTGQVDDKDVINMNSPQAKTAFKHKMGELKRRGAMNELDYSGTRAEMQMYANKQGFNK